METGLKSSRIYSCSELKPTKSNLIEALKVNGLGRNETVWSLANVCCKVFKGSISLDAKWGEGKTFLVKQTKLLLDAYNSQSNELTGDQREKVKNIFEPYDDTVLTNTPVLSIYYDAWANDTDDDPALSLVYEIACATQTEFELKADPALGGIIKKVAKFFGKENIYEFLTENDMFDYLAEIREFKNREKLMHEFLKTILGERGERLVVFVDELDRCNPAYAVKLLERVKHYFDDDRVVFVFSVNTSELQHTIKTYYGAQFDASKYLNRFFTYDFSLPEVNRELFLQWQFGKGKTWAEAIWYCFCDLYKLSLRDMLKMQTNMDVLADNTLEEPTIHVQEEYRFLRNTIVPIAIGLRIVSKNSFDEFVLGKNPEPYVRIASDERCRPCFRAMHRGRYKNEEFAAKIYDVVLGDDPVEKEFKFEDYVFNREMRDRLLRYISQLTIDFGLHYRETMR